MSDDLLTPAEVARILKVSEDTAARTMARIPGTINLGSKGSLNRRRRRLQRTPKAALERFLGYPVSVPEVKKPKARKPVDPVWSVNAAHALAKAIVDNADDATAKAQFETIAFNARTLAFIPEEEWPNITFLGEDNEQF